MQSNFHAVRLSIVVLPFLVVGWLTGCAGGSTSADLLKSEAATHEVVEIAQPAAQVYQQIVTAARPCFARPPWRIEADFFATNNTGRISGAAVGSSIILTLFVADLQPSKSGGTVLTLHSRATEAAVAKAVTSWASGNQASCPRG